MLAKFKSRKFIIALVGQITALVVLFWPEYESEILEVSANVGALILMALTGFGYIQGEAKVDAANASKAFALLFAFLLIPGCTQGVPVASATNVIETLGEDHKQYLMQDTERPPIEIETQLERWEAFKRMTNAVKGGSGDE